MSWFYIDDGRKSGPVSDSELDALLRLGKISPTTLVWREGMSNWQALNISRATGQSGVVCVVCGKAFSPEEVVKINNSQICAQCKPIFLQRMAEGAVTPSISNLWRQNRRLVTRAKTVFPDRCVRCNAPAGGFRLKRTLSWVHPAYLATIIFSPLVLIIVYLIVQKKVVVHIGLCEAHRVQRKAGLAIGWGSLALGIVLICCSFGDYDSGAWWFLSGIMVMMIGGITSLILTGTVAATKMDKEYVWMNGVHRDFLADLPEWNGS